MRLFHRFRAAALVGGIACWPGLLHGQGSGGTQVTVGGRLHTQFNTTSAAGPGIPGSEFLVRRARVDATVRVNDFVSGFVQPEFGEGRTSLRVAYLRLDFGPALRTTIGQFKRPFDLFELTSSNDILVVERTGDIRGVDTCAGVGGVCSLSRFAERLQLVAPDIGLMIEGSDDAARVSYMVSVMNGAGANRADENDAKSFTGRVSVMAARGVRIGANVAFHDYVNAANPAAVRANEYTTALGTDLELGNFTHGLHVQAGVIRGGNWLNLPSGEPTTFATAQAIVTYKAMLGVNRFVTAVEPMARWSYGDPDTDAPADHGTLLTPGILVHLAPRNKIALNVDLWRSARGARESSLKVMSYTVF